MWYILFVEHEGHGERYQISTGCTLPVLCGNTETKAGSPCSKPQIT